MAENSNIEHLAKVNEVLDNLTVIGEKMNNGQPAEETCLEIWHTVFVFRAVLLNTRAGRVLNELADEVPIYLGLDSDTIWHLHQRALVDYNAKLAPLHKTGKDYSSLSD